ncbi:hypothetical protein [Micromonospora sp. KC721]|uniref:hypothetical protein n=1 Tax=Micromonospora sp. KC721 TaxID=2530380 RepID=UPI00104C3A5F|nr:hypothetical protein [Micromonospora sp. KC721]TDB78211.1 hypothetical protein E1182_16165 [Micromonospora sp. KC721]
MSTMPDSIEQRLAASSREYAASARHLLPSRDELPLTPPYERVLHAILDLAKGDWRLVRHYSQVAREDWRDVLYWASEENSAPEGGTKPS